jgi:acyl-CoA thioesterase
MLPDDHSQALADSDPQRTAERAAAAMGEGDAASAGAGVSLAAIEPGRATTRMTVRADHVNGHAICHGGYLFLLADTALAYASNSFGPASVAARADITFLRPARLGDELEAVAQLRARAGRSGIYDVTVRRGTEVIAEFRGQATRLRG